METKKVLILGNEGYIGTALTKHLESKGYSVLGVDNGLREKNVRSIGSESLTKKDCAIEKHTLDISTDYQNLKHLFKEEQPDAIVHLAEQPSAPFSMKSPRDAAETQRNNVIGTLNVLHAMKDACPEAHLVKLGTEGEYPDWLWDGKHIPEGNRMTVGYETEHCTGEGEDMKCALVHDNWEIPTPRYGGSFYHLSKLHDSMNIDYACRIWGLKVTDVNQGVVYGHLPGTRFDYDQYFGTVVNRFVTQAVAGMPLTVYGTGGQTRGFIALQNSLDAITLLIDTPAKSGEFRVIHQTTDAKSVMEIAELVQKITGCEIAHIENPRAELVENKFTFDTTTLDSLGLKPIDMEIVIRELVSTVEAHKADIITGVIKPTTTWK